MRNYFGLLLLLLMFGCQEQPQQTNTPPQLGTISIQVSGDTAALPAFERGMLLLHSFEYEDAAEAFREAQEIDPDFAMAYWGEAMTHNHPLWRQQNADTARAILNRLGPDLAARQAKATTALEQDLLAAVHLLYASGDKHARDQEYADFMADLHDKYPQQAEVSAFYALALLGSVSDGRDEERYGKGAVVAQGILAENPQHPGALHYLIHAYDDPSHATLAVHAADRYAQVAPDASHALHMPSHIYVALGRWDDVVASNEASWQASLDRMERKGLDDDARGYHALHWLLYGYLQQGRAEDAAQLLRNMIGYCENLPSRRARAHLQRLHSSYLVETQDWTGEFERVSVDVSDLNIALQAQGFYLRGRQAFAQADQNTLTEEIHQLDSLCQDHQAKVAQQSIAMCGSYGRSLPTQTDLNQARVVLHQLRALEAWLADDQAQAESWFQRSVALAHATSYSYGPPAIVKPAPELYGEWLLQTQRPEEAAQQFEAALKRAPGRRLALMGKQQAQQALAAH